MDFEKALRAELITIAEINNKVFPINAPEGQLSPYVTYETSGMIGLKTLEGYSNSGSMDCSVDVLEDTYTKLKNLSDKVINKLKSFQGRNIGTDGPYIQNITFDDLNPELYEHNVNKYRKAIGFTVFFEK